MDKLFNILNIDLSKLKKLKLSKVVSLLSNNNFQKTEFHNHVHIHVDNNSVDQINYEALSKIARKQLLEAVLGVDDTMLVPEDVYKRLESAKEYVTEPKSDTLTYFESRLSSDEFRLVRSADYIKKLYQQDKTHEIPELKRQLAELHGQKANVVCNLYTAGYFDTFLKQRYEDMSKIAGFKSNDFHEAYKGLISDFPVAIFVNSSMSENEVESQITNKVKRLRESKFTYLNIHGIGESNINTIEAVLKKLESEEYIETISLSKTSRTVVAKLTLEVK